MQDELELSSRFPHTKMRRRAINSDIRFLHFGALNVSVCYICFFFFESDGFHGRKKCYAALFLTAINVCLSVHKTFTLYLWGGGWSNFVRMKYVDDDFKTHLNETIVLAVSLLGTPVDLSRLSICFVLFQSTANLRWVGADASTSSSTGGVV